MSILASVDRSQTMMEHPSHVLNTSPSAADNWGITGFFSGRPISPYENNCLNRYTQDASGNFVTGPGYFDGTWMMIYFFIPPRRLFADENVWIGQQGDGTTGGSSFGEDLGAMWIFTPAWKIITPAELEPGNPSGLTGMWAVCQLGQSGISQLQNSYKIRCTKPIRPGVFSVTKTSDIYENTIITGDDPSTGNKDIFTAPLLPTLRNEQVQNDPLHNLGPAPLYEVVASDNGETFEVDDTGTFDSVAHFGRAVSFFPQVSYPNRNVTLLPEPLNQYAGPNADINLHAFPADAGMGGQFVGFRS